VLVVLLMDQRTVMRSAHAADCILQSGRSD